MKRPRCRFENRTGRRFCGECGLSLAVTCPTCGFLNEGGEKFCGDVFQWGSIMAGALMAAAPPVIIYAFRMDYYIAG